jgi:uncharacterized membrane protein YfcA
MLMQVLLQACHRIDGNLCDGNISTATLSISIALFLACPAQLFFLKKHVDWKLAIQLSIFQAFGAVAGVRILFLFHSIVLPRILGAILFLVLLQKVCYTDMRSRASEDSLTIQPLRKYPFNSWTNYAVVWTTGLSSGLLSGMFGAAGPPLIIFSSAVNLDKDTTRGTVAFCDVVINFSRITAFIYNIAYASSTNGAAGDKSFESYSQHEWVLYCGMVSAGALTGLCCGNVLAAHVDQSLFRSILLSILGMGSVMLGTVGMSSFTAGMVGLVGFSIIASILLAQLSRAREAGSVFQAFTVETAGKQSTIGSGNEPAYQELPQVDSERVRAVDAP